MKATLILYLTLFISLSACTSNSTQVFDSKKESSKIKYNYSDGYQWAERSGIDNFGDCQDKFGTGDAEDGCNVYVKETSSGYKTFKSYECTEDCSGHQAGYDWAEKKGITDSDDCGGNSQSFIEGCRAYAEENY
jgi:hypothetical protein